MFLYGSLANIPNFPTPRSTEYGNSVAWRFASMPLLVGDESKDLCEVENIQLVVRWACTLPSLGKKCLDIREVGHEERKIRNPYFYGLFFCFLLLPSRG